MKVAFWSSGRSRGVTTCAVSAGLMSACTSERRVALMDNHCRDRALERTILERPPGSVSCETQYWLSGNSAGTGIMEYTARRTDRPGWVDNYLEVIGKRLWLECADVSMPELLFESRYGQFPDAGGSFLRDSDLCMIDTQSGGNLSTKTVLEQADLVAVVLPGNRSGIERFFIEYGSIVNKSVFILNKYQTISGDIPKQLRSDYSIDSDRLIMIPYCADFALAASQGRAREFFLRNSDSKRGSSAYRFITSVKYMLEVIDCETLRRRRAPIAYPQWPEIAAVSELAA